MEYDDFYGDQSSDSSASSDDGDAALKHGNIRDRISSDPFGTVANHEYRAREASVQTLSYLDGYDETKEIKLQEGFSHGYRLSFHDAFRVGRCIGSLCAKVAQEEILMPVGVNRKDGGAAAGNTFLSATRNAMEDSAALVRNFLREEILIERKERGFDKKYDDKLLQLENQLGKLGVEHATNRND